MKLKELIKERRDQKLRMWAIENTCTNGCIDYCSGAFVMELADALYRYAKNGDLSALERFKKLSGRNY